MPSQYLIEEVDITSAPVSIGAVVVSVRLDVERPYVVTRALGTNYYVTFTLSDRTWKSDSPPIRGARVQLSKLFRTKRGAQADQARFLSDVGTTRPRSTKAQTSRKKVAQ